MVSLGSRKPIYTIYHRVSSININQQDIPKANGQMESLLHGFKFFYRVQDGSTWGIAMEHIGTFDVFLHVSSSGWVRFHGVVDSADEMTWA